jgi:hypothetical protein
MISKEATITAVAAAMVFIILPLGYLAFISYHVIYQVWWKGRARYNIVEEEEKEEKDSKCCSCCTKEEEGEEEGGWADEDDNKYAATAGTDEDDDKNAAAAAAAAAAPATNLQTLSRGASCRGQQQMDDTAAIKLQAVTRGGQARRMQTENTAAATRLQAASRGWQSRKEARASFSLGADIPFENPTDKSPALLEKYEEQSVLNRRYDTDFVTDGMEQVEGLIDSDDDDAGSKKEVRAARQWCSLITVQSNHITVYSQCSLFTSQSIHITVYSQCSLFTSQCWHLLLTFPNAGRGRRRRGRRRGGEWVGGHSAW